MKIVVTDLTRMYDGHICAAGIDLASGRRVRPVSGRLPSALLRAKGGPFDIRAIVDLGATRRIGVSPEVEDALFRPVAAQDCGDMPAGEFYELLSESVSESLRPIGSALERVGGSMATPEGQGDRSLVLLRWNELPKLFVVEGSRLRFRFSGDVQLSVTDVRLYKSDLMTPDPEKLALLHRRLDDSPEAIICFGLGRAWQRPEESVKRHYLQVNNIHLKAHPEWQHTYRPWTPQEEDRLRTHHAAGSPLQNVATELDRPVEAVRAHVASLGKKLLGKKPPDAEEAPEETTSRPVPEFIARAREKHPRAFQSWSGQEDQRLLALWRSGQTTRAIAEDLGRTPRAIWMRLTLLGADSVSCVEVSHALDGTGEPEAPRGSG